MNFTIDLSEIDVADLEINAAHFGRCEFEFADRPELETIFQELRDILQAEVILRKMGICFMGPQNFDIIDDFVLGPAACIMLHNIFRRWANGEDPARRVIGSSLERLFVLE